VRQSDARTSACMPQRGWAGCWTCHAFSTEADAAASLVVKYGLEARAHVDATPDACCVRRDEQ
jgi:hypothetical protein